MRATDETILSYYRQPGPMTDPRKQAYLLDDLPADLGALCKTLQGVMLHIFWAESYGVELSDERKAEVQLRCYSTYLPTTLAKSSTTEKRSTAAC